MVGEVHGQIFVWKRFSPPNKMVLVNKDMYICLGHSAKNNMYITAKVIK